MRVAYAEGAVAEALTRGLNANGRMLAAKRADSAECRQQLAAGYDIGHEADRLAEFYEVSRMQMAHEI